MGTTTCHKLIGGQRPGHQGDQDTHRRHLVRRGPQAWHGAPPRNLAPAPAAQEPPPPAGGPTPPRCGVPDPPDGLNARNRQKRFVLSGGRWEKTDLTYRILRYPWQLVREQVRQTVAEALRVWSEVTPLTFTEVHEGRADIMIDFTRYSHGDDLPFDGPGGVLAHAFFPKTNREGDVHFDYDETWTIGDNQGMGWGSIFQIGQLKIIENGNLPRSQSWGLELGYLAAGGSGIAGLFPFSRHRPPAGGSPRIWPYARVTAHDGC